jgi:peroxiredoxin
METVWCSTLALAGLLVPPIPDFELRDAGGTPRRLGEWDDRRVVVLVFLSVDCPLARLYAPRLAEWADAWHRRGVAVVGIEPNCREAAAVQRFVREYGIRFPLLLDLNQTAVSRLAATCTPEAFVLDGRRVVRYRGRIDDQYGVGGRRSGPTRPDLSEAVEDVLAGRPVRVPVTQATGCSIERPLATPLPAPVTYFRDVAPLLHRRCVPCHRPGQVGPFSLTSYRQAAARARGMREAVIDGRMPPWNAEPAHGRFANDPRLSAREKELLNDWVTAGCPEGDRGDLPTLPPFPDGWSIPQPDLILIAPPFRVPAEGVVEYQRFVVDPGFGEDRWVRAAEVRPGNRRVVHHCLVFLQPPGCDEPAEGGALGSFCLAVATPGTPPLVLPEGMAKRVPAGWRLLFVVHYAPVGTEQSDQTSLGLIFADPKTVKREVATKLIYDPHLCIPPRASDHRVVREHRFEDEVMLLSLLPHMHFRGKSFRYEAAYPGGREEILLDVPRYDFNWQHRYVLAEPKRLPAGTVLRCTAVYDNSAANPFNPDPEVTVYAGLQSWDEMFNGYFEFVSAEPPKTARSGILWLLVPVLGVALLMCHRRRRGWATTA